LFTFFPCRQLLRPLCFLIVVVCLTGACRNSGNEPYLQSNSSFCQSAFTPSLLRQLASHFVSQDLRGRRAIFDTLDESIKAQKVQGHEALDNSGSAVYKLKGYFDDILNPKPFREDGRSRKFRVISNDVLVLPFATKGGLKPKAWPTELLPSDRSEAYWQSWPIPRHLQVVNYPLYRGDKVFTQMGQSQSILADDSPLWDLLDDIFLNGFYIADSAGQRFFHHDVFEHSIDSSSSTFISSSKDFEVASDFGLDKSTGWSGVLEFRGQGIDVVATSEYFSRLGFLRSLPGLSPREKEVALSYGVMAYQIKGLWLIDRSGRKVFIPNPNFVETN
jgi:hypothetical protein